MGPQIPKIENIEKGTDVKILEWVTLVGGVSLLLLFTFLYFNGNVDPYWWIFIQVLIPTAELIIAGSLFIFSPTSLKISLILSLILTLLFTYASIYSIFKYFGPCVGWECLLLAEFAYAAIIASVFLIINLASTFICMRYLFKRPNQEVR